MDYALALGWGHELELEGGVACRAHSLHMQTDKKACHTPNPESQVWGMEDDFPAKAHPTVAQAVPQIEISVSGDYTA